MLAVNRSEGQENRRFSSSLERRDGQIRLADADALDLSGWSST